MQPFIPKTPESVDHLRGDKSYLHNRVPHRPPSGSRNHMRLTVGALQTNTRVYTTCSGTGKLRYVKYNFGEGRPPANGVNYFVDFEGHVGGYDENGNYGKIRGMLQLQGP